MSRFCNTLNGALSSVASDSWLIRFSPFAQETMFLPDVHLASERCLLVDRPYETEQVCVERFVGETEQTRSIVSRSKQSIKPYAIVEHSES